MKKLVSSLQTHNLFDAIGDAAIIHLSASNILQEANDVTINALKLTPLLLKNAIL